MTKLKYTSLRCYIIIAALLSIIAVPASAFDLTHYTEKSVLSEGRWVKIGVKESGLYMIPTSTLRSWGFDDVSRVRIYGYGGARIDDVMTVANYIDDLPLIYSDATDAGVVFYAAGPDVWESANAGQNYYHKEWNPYTSMGYYFVTQNDEALKIPPTVGNAGTDGEPASSALNRIHYEIDEVQASEAGPLMVGEDFRYTPSRSFSFSTPGRVEDEDVYMECRFIARTLGVPSQLSFTLDGTAVAAENSDRIPTTSSSSYVYASIGTTRHTLHPEKVDGFTLGVRHSSSGIVHLANLDYISISYLRHLSLPSDGKMRFWSSSRSLSMSSATDDLQLWDVSDPSNLSLVDFDLTSDKKAVWQTSEVGQRCYVAWRPGANLPVPEFVGKVSNQNLHDPTEAVDMIIFNTPALGEQAERIKALHENYDSMRVAVVDVNKVYNEFSSGMPDVSALRKYLKMIYDRGKATERPLCYALLLGRTTLDHRTILSTTKALGYTTMPVWVVRSAGDSMTDNTGFSTDDFIAMLEDDSGRDMGFDHLSIAVGRIPMMSARDGDDIVDKLYQYVENSRRTGWKNRIMVLADDEDLGVHLHQTETMVENFMNTPNQQHLVTKVYLDAYTKSSGQYPEARRDMFQTLEEGVVWWFYVGHANNHSWTADGQLTYTDINGMYLRNVPFLVAATCNFLRWDSETTSGGEIMYKERYGGAIGMISATRPVYISDNGYFLASLGRSALARDNNGSLLRAGEVYRRTKNDIRNSEGVRISNPNRLRFVFMGDPAMRLAGPDNIVELLSINGQPVDPDSQITLAAMANATITGRVVDPNRQLLSDFNGTVNIEIFDALKSVTTNANGNGSEDVFDTHGDKLFAGAARVSGGEFTLTVAMPAMVADNFRPATMSLYAAADNSNDEAIGANREFYVYGFEEPAEADTIAPTIHSMTLNHANFKSGESVNTSPMLIAEVSDNVGINLSRSGVGHQMTVIVDDIKTYNDIATFYTPNSSGDVLGGVINYPFENLSEGAHTMRLKVFDTSGNAAEHTIEFFVDEFLVPQIFDVYTDANPARESAKFYVKHDRPEGVVGVTVEVFDLLGRPIWTGSSKGMSDMDVSAPVTWDLTDSAGRRVERGIYLYRASISTDNANYTTASRRIAVTAQ